MFRVVLFFILVVMAIPDHAPWAAETSAPPRIPDIESFMQIGFAGSPELAPDGNTLYFISNSSGVAQIYRLDQSNRWPYQLTVFTEGVDFFTLSPDGASIVCGVGSGGNENSQLWLLDAWTGAARALTDSPEVRHGAPSWTSDGSTIFYRSNEANGKDFYIYRMNLRTEKKDLVADLEGWNAPGDVSDDDRRLLIGHYDSNTNSEVYLLDLEGGRRKGKLTHLTPHEGEVIYHSAQFSRDDNRIYLVSNGNPEGIARRAVVDVDSKELEFIDTEGIWEVESMGLSPDRKVMGWTVNEGGYSRLKLHDLEADQEIVSPPVDGLVSGFDFSEGHSLAFSFSSATSTADVWIWDWKAPSLTKATFSTYAGIDPSLFSSPKLIHYVSFDGLEIPAFLYLPPGYQAGNPVPFVVHVHGGPESQFQPSFIRHFQFLLLHGFGVLAPNVRGSSGYGKEYQDLDNYTKRLDSVKDLKAGADYLIAQGYSAEGMLAVKGGSYGGYMTLAAITEYPGLFSAAVDEVGIANFVTFLENTADYRRHLREAEYGPLTDREFLESISPLHKADRIQTPLLVVHGENDPRVPVGEARQIISALEERGVPVESLIFEDEGHGVSKRSNALVLYRRMVEFLEQQLKGNDPGGME